MGSSIKRYAEDCRKVVRSKVVGKIRDENEVSAAYLQADLNRRNNNVGWYTSVQDAFRNEY